MSEILFIVKEDEDGGYHARAVGYSIFTQGDTREELEAMVRDAVKCHFDPEQEAPKIIHLHYVHDEVIAL
ncbi:MAG: 2-oxoisovalerate dehydrogenase [Planctomycetota bacterium]|nr:2-oxoisovalerate dehydrogenase [Planctomycetota bacterium]